MEPITNEAGQVALKYRRQVPKIVRCNGKEHVFQLWANVSLYWADPEDVDCLLETRRSCCGGSSKIVVIYANENDVRQWTNRGGR